MTTDFDSRYILLAEDNDDDVFIFQRAIKQGEVKNPVYVVSDGEELTDYLSGTGKFADRKKYPLPFLLVLDLKLPLRHGLEALEWLRAQPQLRDLTVVVLTSSAEPRDLKRARELGARFYLVKPPKAKTLTEMLALLCDPKKKTAKLDGDLLAGVDPKRA